MCVPLKCRHELTEAGGFPSSMEVSVGKTNHKPVLCGNEWSPLDRSHTELAQTQ